MTKKEMIILVAALVAGVIFATQIRKLPLANKLPSA